MQVQRQLLVAATATAKHHCRHQRIGDRSPFVGERHSHARRLADFLGFAKNDVQDGTVDGAVGRKHHDRANEFGGLSETIYATFALLMARRIPGKVVVDHGVEQLLKVDPLRQAVRSDKDALICGSTFLRRHFRDAIATFVRCQFTRHGLHIQLGEGRTKPFLHVFGRGEVAAEDDGVSAVFDQGFEGLDEGVQLGIFGRQKFAGLVEQPLKSGVI